MAAGLSPHSAANWFQDTVLRFLRQHGGSLDRLPLRAAELASLVRSVEDGRMGRARARTILASALAGERPLAELLAAAPEPSREETDADAGTGERPTNRQSTDPPGNRSNG